MFDDFAEPNEVQACRCAWAKRSAKRLADDRAALFAFAPKCPTCFPAYFGIFGAATASTSAYRAWLPLLSDK